MQHILIESITVSFIFTLKDDRLHQGWEHLPVYQWLIPTPSWSSMSGFQLQLAGPFLLVLTSTEQLWPVGGCCRATDRQIAYTYHKRLFTYLLRVWQCNNTCHISIWINIPIQAHKHMHIHSIIRTQAAKKVWCGKYQTAQLSVYTGIVVVIAMMYTGTHRFTSYRFAQCSRVTIQRSRCDKLGPKLACKPLRGHLCFPTWSLVCTIACYV